MIAILLVDDHVVVRAGYRALLAKQSDLQVIAEAADTAEAYRKYRQQPADLVITDISLPGSSGLELVARLRQLQPDARILVFSMHQNPLFAEQALRAGALGYVTKSSQPEELLRAVREVSAGRHVLSADIAQAMALAKLGDSSPALRSLTVREFEILRLLVAGNSVEAIAASLHISPKTVCNCHYLIKRKLGVGSDIEMTRLAIQWQVLDLAELAGK